MVTAELSLRGLRSRHLRRALRKRPLRGRFFRPPGGCIKADFCNYVLLLSFNIFSVISNITCRSRGRFGQSVKALGSQFCSGQSVKGSYFSSGQSVKGFFFCRRMSFSFWTMNLFQSTGLVSGRRSRGTICPPRRNGRPILNVTAC